MARSVSLISCWTTTEHSPWTDVPYLASRALKRLARSLHIHVVTADTFGRARAGMADVGCKLEILRPDARTGRRRRMRAASGRAERHASATAATTRSMLRVARLGVALVQAKGAAAEPVVAADLVLRSINDALDLFLQPRRLVASLGA